ncbi:OB-fold protein [Wenyingzhuangia sp. IMCC45574]
MSRFKLLIFISISIIAIVLFVLWINKPYPNMQMAKTEATVSAKIVTNEYLKNENIANAKYRNKVIEVVGVVKNINLLNNRNTIILKGINKDINILCDMQKQTKLSLKTNDQIKVKGLCKGFLKDIVLLNCILINTNNHEEN